MTKREIYNAALELRRKSGQGLPGLMLLGENIEPCEELVKEGKLKKVEITYSYLPNDTFYCVNDGGYCIEDDYDMITFLRYFLGQGDEEFINGVKDEDGNKVYNKDVVNANKDDYDKWLETNRESLEILLTAEDLDETDFSDFSDEEIEFIKSRKWFKNDTDVKECRNINNKQLNNQYKVIDINKQLISLYKSKGDSEQDIEKSKQDIEKAEENILTRKKIIRKLKECKFVKDLI